ncbi:MAG TPA: 7-cyano-7-deazaguanine synthase [Verrucomicrobiae bacterium]|nr:7-cyano-7-deazaguanine synthase [Verrucomicrobiae bacterium]
MKAERSGVAVCALVSGGLDSCVMLAELARRYRRVYPVFIREGLVWENAELSHLRRFLRVVAVSPARGRPRRSFAATIQPLTVLHFPVADLYEAHWSVTGRKVPGAKTADQAVYLPGRNLLLLSKAAVFCARHRIGVVALGSLGHNPFPDATPRFFREFSRVASDALGRGLKIVAPFRLLTKDRVVRRGVRLGLPLHLSFSCLSPRRGRHCGRCNKCAERRRAFREAGVGDLISI